MNITNHWNCKERATNPNLHDESLWIGHSTAIHFCDKCFEKFEESGEVDELFKDNSVEHMCLKDVIAKNIIS